VKRGRAGDREGKNHHEKEKRAKKKAQQSKGNARRVGTVVTVVVAVDRDVDAIFLKQGLVGEAHALDFTPVLCVGRVPRRKDFLLFLKSSR
jgi:chorismate mutase